jgi:DNA repair protein RecO (recombination protein O)
MSVAQRRTDALVLKRKLLPTQDVLVFLFTKEFGKVIAMARGIKKLTSRRAPHLETGNYIRVILSVHGEYSHIQDTSLISGFTTIKGSTNMQDALYTYLFALDRLLPAEQAEPQLFQHTLAFFGKLNRNPQNADVIVREQMRHALNYLGYLHPTHQGEYEQVFEEVTGEKLPVHAV